MFLIVLAAMSQPAAADGPGLLTVTEYVGKGGWYAHRDGPGAEARFRFPTGLAVDAGGRVYVSDSSPTVRRIDLDGTVTTIAGIADSYGLRDGAAVQSLFSSPRALVVDPEGNIFVTDEGNHTIRKISAGGEVTTVAGQANIPGKANGDGASAQFNLPRGLARDAVGNLYVADQGNRQIRRITTDGMVSLFAAGVGSTPEGLEFDSAGNLIVADWGGGTGGKLFRITPAGKVSVLAVTPVPGFSDPTDVARDGSGNLFITDTRNECIRAVLSGGQVTVFSGLAKVPGGEDGPPATARFRGPRAVAFAPDGSLWVADTENGAIRRLQPDGTAVTVAGLPRGSRDGVGSDARFSGPGAIAVGPDGSLWVADSDNQTIRRVDSDRRVTTVAGVAGVSGKSDGPDGEARFNRPIGIAVNRDGVVFIVDSSNSCIRRRTPDGTVDTLAGKPGNSGFADGQGDLARFTLPGGIALDPAGNLLVADTYNHCIRGVSPEGMVSTVAGIPNLPGAVDGPSASARFNAPMSLTVAPDGTVFVSDSGNSTIRRISVDGSVSTIAGLAGAAGFADGPGETARFNNPAGLALDSHGDLHVADMENRCIRRVTPAGGVTTVAGQPGPFGSDVGTGSEARFFRPAALAFDSHDRLFIADSSDNVIRLATRAVGTPPAIKVGLQGSSARLSWPGSASGVVLQQANTLTQVPIWTPVEVAPVVENGEASVTVTVRVDSRFYRLALP